MLENEDTDAHSQGASWGWWGWLEEHLVRSVTDLKKEWKGKVRVHMLRTDGFRFSLSHSAILIWQFLSFLGRRACWWSR